MTSLRFGTSVTKLLRDPLENRSHPKSSLTMVLLETVIALHSTAPFGAIPNMPSTQPRTSDRPSFQMTPERVRTAIIVSGIVGSLAILILGYLLLKRRMNRGVKAGRLDRHYDDDPRIKMIDKELETGVIQEPLPVYAEPKG